MLRFAPQRAPIFSTTNAARPCPNLSFETHTGDRALTTAGEPPHAETAIVTPTRLRLQAVDEILLDWLRKQPPFVDAHGHATTNTYLAARRDDAWEGTLAEFRRTLTRLDNAGKVARVIIGKRCYRIEWCAEPRPLVEVLAQPGLFD